MCNGSGTQRTTREYRRWHQHRQPSGFLHVFVRRGITFFFHAFTIGLKRFSVDFQFLTIFRET